MIKAQIRKGILVLFSLLLISVLAASCSKKTEAPAPDAGGNAEPAKKVAIRLVVPSPAGDDLTVKDEKFAERFNERAASYGYTIKVYPGGQLVKVNEFMDAVRTGAVEMFDAGLPIYGGLDARFNLTNLPYLFNDGKACMLAEKELADYYNKILEPNFNQKMLGYVYSGSRDIYTVKKQIILPEDCKGLVFGCSDRILVDMAAQMGASPISIPWPDYYTSLDKGVVDGVFTSANGAIANKLYDVCKYQTDLQTPVGPNMYHINLDIWKGMPKEVQDILVEELEKTIKETGEYFIAQHQKDLETLRASGVEVHVPTPEEVAKFKAVIMPYTEKSLAEFGEDGKIVKEIADRANAKSKS